MSSGAGVFPRWVRVLRGRRETVSAGLQRLEQPARLLLHAAAILNPQPDMSAELSQHLREGTGWSAADFERALDTCLDLNLLDGATRSGACFELFAAFLRETTPPEEDRAALAKAREAQWGCFVELAEAVEENPADTQKAAALIGYPLWPELWVGLGVSCPSKSKFDRSALYEIGRFEEARPWCERAVVEAEKGDVHGRIDHASLGSSLHEVGYCLSRTGQYAEARVWYERAVAEQEKGDVDGRVDHASVGRSLHHVGYGLASTGQYAEAGQWFERAVVEKEEGNVEGRIDHQSVGRSLHHVGECLARTGQYAEARPWFERAVAEKEKGDVEGRIDHRSLGRSLHQVGYCLWSTGRHPEARLWFERAVRRRRKGTCTVASTTKAWA